MHKLAKILGSGAVMSVIPAIAWGQDAPTLESLAANDAFVFNTLLFLIGGFLVMWMAACLLYTSPSPRDGLLSRMPSSA